MDDLPIQSNQPQPMQQPIDPTRRRDDRDNRVDPPKDDKDKFAKKVASSPRRKDEDEELGSLISALRGSVGDDDDGKDSSIFSLSRNSAKPSKKKETGKEDLVAAGQAKGDLTGVGSGDDSTSGMGDTDEDGKKDNKLDYSQDSRQDIFQLNAFNSNSVAMFDAEKVNSSNLSRQETVDLVNQMIERISIMKTQGETDTQLTLKYPPLFEGAQVTIKQFDSAAGQFNFSFQNLSAQAKKMMDMQSSRQMLLQSLHEKGYQVHIITTTQEIESPEFIQDPSSQQNQRDNKGGGGQDQDKKDQQQK